MSEQSQPSETRPQFAISAAAAPQESTPLSSSPQSYNYGPSEESRPQGQQISPNQRAGSHSRARRRAQKKVHNHEPKRKINAVSLRLMNNGNVARDHLASERTYLAYVRTSLGMASAGVALMQFLYLGDSTKAFAGPIGAAMVVASVIMLLIGARRYFLVQRSLVEGFYPAMSLEVVIIGMILGGVIAGVFGTVISGRYINT